MFLRLIRTTNELSKGNGAPLAALVVAAAVALDATVLLVFGGNLDTLSFLITTTVIAVAVVAAVVVPRVIGHVLAALLGVASLLAGGASIFVNMTPTLPVTLALVGVLLGWLTVLSLKGSRVAWSFLVAICGVMFVCMFFGAPKVKSIMGLNIWMALIPPGLFGAATIALSLISKDYATEGDKAA